MAYEFKLPDLGEGLTEGEIARWLVAEGQEVGEDDPLVEIATDKTTVEIPSPAAGVVARILVAEGEVVPVGTVLVVIGGDGAEPESEPEQPRAEQAPAAVRDMSRGQSPGHVRSGQVRATPLVRRIAQELGVELESVTPSGPGGRVTEDDVRDAAAGGPPSAGRREKVRGVRRQIVEHLSRAHREVPAVTYVEECDFTGVDVKRIVALTLKACAGALREFPELNARLEGDEIVYVDRYDLGVAVQTDDGLVVPVVRGCDTASLEELDAEVRRLADAARAGTLKPEELRDSTFTVTRSRARSLRAMCASRLSIRLAGPERREEKKTSRGWASRFTVFRERARRSGWANGGATMPVVGDWYLIGLLTGVGSGLGVLFTGMLAPLHRGVLIAAVLAVAVAVGIAFGVENWNEAVGGGLGALGGTIGSGAVVTGALRRGGTRIATALIVGLAALVVAALAFVPVLGYLEALALSVLGLRLRGQEGRRYAGLRVLARD